MLNDSPARSDAVLCTVEPEPWRGDTTDAYTLEDMKRYQDKHSPTTRKDSTVPSSYSVQQLKLSTLLSHSFSSSHAASLSLPLRACVTSPAQSLLSVSQIQNLPLSAPARSVCPANPSPPPPRLLLLLCWPLSLSLSLACLLTCFFFSSPPPPPRLSLALSLCLPLTLFFPSPTRSFLSFYPQPSVLLLCPCLLISSVSSPVLLLSFSLTQIA